MVYRISAQSTQLESVPVPAAYQDAFPMMEQACCYGYSLCECTWLAGYLVIARVDSCYDTLSLELISDTVLRKWYEDAKCEMQQDTGGNFLWALLDTFPSSG